MKYEPLLHVVLYQPEIPQNTGNIGRTCVAAQAKLWLVRPLGFHLDDRHLRRAGLDYWQHLDWEAAADWPNCRPQLPQRIWYFSKTAEKLYTSVEFEAGDALVFGSETQGLPARLLAENKETCLRIPTRSSVRSLNLSSAVAVAVYEALRQLRRHGHIVG